MLQSPSLEDGLRVLLAAIIGERAVEAGLWVWPEPSVVAIGLIGTARLYEVRSHELARVPPTDETLVGWSQLASPARCSVTPLGAVGAICLPATCRPCSAEEERWYGIWLEWLTTREQTLRDAKLKSMAEFAGGAGHEINNPLATILGRSQLLLRQEIDPERRRWLSAIGGQALRIRDMISDTMVFARPPAPKIRPVEVEPLIRSVTDRFAEELQSANIQLQVSLSLLTPSSLHDSSPSTLNPQLSSLPLDPEQFQVVCIELLRNAIRAVSSLSHIPNGNPNEHAPLRQIGLRARPRTWQGRNWLELDLANNGPELTSADRMHAFDPFYSGRDAGRGLGFGLTKCWRILTLHGGHIHLHSTPATTTFRTLWPVDRVEDPNAPGHPAAAQ